MIIITIYKTITVTISVTISIIRKIAIMIYLKL